MKRGQFLKYVAIGGGAALTGGGIGSLLTKKDPADQRVDRPFSQPLRLPEEIRENDITLTTAPGTWSAVPEAATSPAYLVNGALPSPTIRARQGETLHINFKNSIDQESILHWHGLNMPWKMDGHPIYAIQAGKTYPYHFTIHDRAGTYLYHPHPAKITGPQAYKGIMGLFIIEDGEEQRLNLPAGAYDLPLLIQDKRIDGQDLSLYELSMMDQMMGYLGNEVYVNGVRSPWHDISSGWYRLRLANASNARIFRLHMDDNRPFHLIGSDGGLLAKPINIRSLRLAPFERADVLADFTGEKAGAEIRLLADFVDAMGGMMGNGMMGMMRNRGTGMSGNENSHTALSFRVTRTGSDSFHLPERLSSPPFPNPEKAVRTRKFDLTMIMMQGFEINGKKFKIDRVDEEVPLGDTEIWEFTNRSMMPHPMHVHDTQFKVLSRSGGPLQPTESGLKDTVLVMPNETVRVCLKFERFKGMYMVHCHNLEHEDAGMMLNFKVA